MLYLTESFPPVAELHISTNTICTEYTFRYKKWDLAHCSVSLSKDKKIIYIENIAKAINIPPYFQKEHICTELLNVVLLNMFWTWNILPEQIQGTLSFVDGYNGNWMRSIPFYQHFPKHLNERLPYTLSCTITNEDGTVIMPEGINNMEILMKPPRPCGA